MKTNFGACKLNHCYKLVTNFMVGLKFDTNASESENSN